MKMATVRVCLFIVLCSCTPTTTTPPDSDSPLRVAAEVKRAFSAPASVSTRLGAMAPISAAAPGAGTMGTKPDLATGRATASLPQTSSEGVWVGAAEHTSPCQIITCSPTHSPTGSGRGPVVGGGIWLRGVRSGVTGGSTTCVCTDGVGNTPWRKKSERPSHFRCTLLPTGGDTHTLWTAKESGGSKQAASAPNVSRLAQSSATTLGV